MPIVCYVSELDKSAPLDAERLLRLLGVSLTGLTDDSFEQLSFFEDTREKERRQKLDAALDSIRLKYGNDKVTRASIMNSTARIGRKAKAQMENEREQ